MVKKVLTLAFPCRDRQILLGFKKRGFGAGLYNGFGGKLEAGETIEAGMLRELKEEVALAATKYVKLGVITFCYTDSELEVHVFKVTEFLGTPTESEEMTAVWFEATDIPFGQMWPDDEYWLPLLVENKPFVGRYWFGEETDELGRLKITRQELTELKATNFA
jgi:8-oxo-dGTP diphosphatase / 2-hydroxy-dATP diphosphatase